MFKGYSSAYHKYITLIHRVAIKNQKANYFWPKSIYQQHVKNISQKRIKQTEPILCGPERIANGAVPQREDSLQSTLFISQALSNLNEGRESLAFSSAFSMESYCAGCQIILNVRPEWGFQSSLTTPGKAWSPKLSHSENVIVCPYGNCMWWCSTHPITFIQKIRQLRETWNWRYK